MKKKYSNLKEFFANEVTEGEMYEMLFRSLLEISCRNRMFESEEAFDNSVRPFIYIDHLLQDTQ